MTIQTEGKNVPLRGSHLKWFVAGGCSVALLLTIGCIGVSFLLVRGVSGEPPTADVAERITGEFVQALRDGNIEAAYQMSSEEVRSVTLKNDLSKLAETGEYQTVFKTYQSLQICDWGFFITNKRRFISAKGLLHYKSGDIVFEDDLRQDSDSAWRLYGFRLKPNIEPELFGRCR